MNEHLAAGQIDVPAMWPHRKELASKTVQFQFEFGLGALPTEPGLLIIRGARQYGKSTWLEEQLYQTVRRYGPGSAFTLNGDEIASGEAFTHALEELATSYHPDVPVKRLFIDEVTAIPQWEKGLKKVLDRGECRDVLIVTTGSKAADLRHGSERLPGRKGKLGKTDYLFLPISYAEFKRHASPRFQEKTWIAYLLTGGSPIACHEIIQTGRLPEYFIQLIRDWVLGEIIATGRSRLFLSHLLSVLLKYGGDPVGYAKVAREAGLANNTVASGYLEQLSDLLCVLPSWPWDEARKKLEPRKACKFHFINTAALIALHPLRLRSVEDFDVLPPETQAIFLEWLAAQEIWRRTSLHDPYKAEFLGFWQSGKHEIDFVTPEESFIEVKRGRAGPLDFGWFSKIFPKRNLIVICTTPFQTRHIQGITMDTFLSAPR